MPRYNLVMGGLTTHLARQIFLKLIYMKTVCWCFLYLFVLVLFAYFRHPQHLRNNFTFAHLPRGSVNPSPLREDVCFIIPSTCRMSCYTTLSNKSPIFLLSNMWCFVLFPPTFISAINQHYSPAIDLSVYINFTMERLAFQLT